MKKLIISLLSILIFTTVADAQTEVLSGIMRGKDYGVLYTLPKTEIKIDVKVAKVVYTPGEFSRYADRYLYLPDVSSEAAQYWILEGITVTSAGIPDSENTYFVKMKDKTVAPLMELTPDGIVKSINVPYNSNKTTDNKNVISAAKVNPNPRDFLTEEILTASSTAKKAELVAREIYNIRESRNALTRGQADNMPNDGEQMKLMLNNLDLQESALLKLFTGTESKEEQTLSFKFDPNKECTNEVAFRFSKLLGILDAGNLAGEPAYITINDLKTVAIPEPKDKKKEEKKINGIAYNAPGKGRVSVVYGKTKLFEDDLPITQFGTIEYLAPELFNKNSTIQVIFNPATGGLVKVDENKNK